VFHLNYLDLQRSGVSQTRISSGQITQNNGSQYGGGGGGSGSGSNNGSNGNNGSDQGDEQQSSKDVSGTAVVTRNDSNFWTGIEADVRALVGSAAGNSVVINRQSGVIVARGMPSELRDVADYLSKTQQTVTRQVILEAKIVEVALNDSYQAGINWSAVFTRGGDQYFVGQAAPQGFDSGQLVGPSGPINVSPGNPISGFVNNTLGGAFTLAADLTDFNAFIDLLSTQGQTRVLSSPRVATLHNQKAVIKAGTDEFFVTGVQSDTVTGTASTTNVNFELTPFFSGVALDVTPQISEDGRVLLHIHPAVSDVNNQTKMLTVRGQTDTLPLALSQIRESDSIVSARSGQVIVIGGLMRETRDRQQFKTPLLGDIPGVGRLFRSEREKKLTSELVILLRPMVVNDNDWPTLVSGPSERIEKMTKKNKLK
jgi:MSHA biogenesis protein MshL